MATERQVEANRRNAARSTGPKSEAGKAKSRVNAVTHGLASETVQDSGRSEAFEARRAAWGAEQGPLGESAGWALDRAVAASLRIERVEQAMEDHIESTRQRARLAWDEDRSVEAAETFARLGRDPVVAARKLRATLAGAILLSEAWTALGETLRLGDWSDGERSRALDLLGVAPDLRQGWTAIDPPPGDDPLDFRKGLVVDEVERLEAAIHEAFAPLDEGDRRRAISGDLALISRPGKLLARYERDAWRHYRESMAEVRTAEPQTQAAPPPSPPVRPQAPAAPKPAAPPAGDGLRPCDVDDPSTWRDEMFRQFAIIEASKATAQDRGAGTNPISVPELALA